MGPGRFEMPARQPIDTGPSRPAGAATLGPLTEVAEQPLHRALGLTDGELDRIRELLEREPNHFELAVFSLLWSEHCGYKHSALAAEAASRPSGERVLQGPGENAGVLDLGDGEAVAFKVESHNHPSAVEPFQGAATGVGGILRDIVAMGARPIALLDGLRFGEPDHRVRPRRRRDRPLRQLRRRPDRRRRDRLRRGATRTTASSTRCASGLLPADRVTRARRADAGQPASSSTARRPAATGSAARACSRARSSARAPRRSGPSVQIGDPFTGKKLIEVSLELVERGLVESLQDCGAAGLASSLAEMARDGAGIDVHLDRVPLREDGMEPWEMMISESQERMVAVVRPGLLDGGRGGLRALGAATAARSARSPTRGELRALP